MGIAIAGSGRQEGDGRVGELKLGVMGDLVAVGAQATLTVAQLMAKIVSVDPSTSAANYTLPTVALLEAALPDKKVGTTFELTIVNLGSSSGVATIVAGTGWTLVGMVTLPITTSAGSSGTFRARKVSATAWTLYRIS